MAPALVATSTEAPGPHPSYIQVAKPFIFEQKVQSRILAAGANPAREDAYRLQGVQWIDEVRRALQLPVRTFNTSAIYYHKFRLIHKDTDYQYADAAAAALFTACKIEDTLKKSKEILCAAYNLKASEHLTPDDSVFESPSKTIIGLERLMLEASGFDYRNRYPQKYLFKLAKRCELDQDVIKVGFKMMLDLYRTFAPLKQTSAAMAFACLELATRVMDKQQSNIRSKKAPKHGTWMVYRQEIMEAMLDLLDLYTHFQKSSLVGPAYHIDRFINVRIALNQESEERKFARHTVWKEHKPNGIKSNIKTPKTPITPVSPSDIRKDVASPATLSPRSSGSGRRGIGARGQEGTVRFMLEGIQVRRERAVVAEYFKTEYEEYEEEVDEPIATNNHDHKHRHDKDERNGRSERYDRDYKRPRR